MWLCLLQRLAPSSRRPQPRLPRALVAMRPPQASRQLRQRFSLPLVFFPCRASSPVSLAHFSNVRDWTIEFTHAQGNRGSSSGAKRELDMRGVNLDLFGVAVQEHTNLDGRKTGITFFFNIPPGQQQENVSSVRVKQASDNMLHCWFGNPAPSSASTSGSSAPSPAATSEGAASDGVVEKVHLRKVSLCLCLSLPIPWLNLSPVFSRTSLLTKLSLSLFLSLSLSRARALSLSLTHARTYLWIAGGFDGLHMKELRCLL